jgi:hypothetical protein
MRTVIITPRDKREFDLAFGLMIESGKERKRQLVDERDDIGFCFLMQESHRSKEVDDKVQKESFRRQ